MKSTFLKKTFSVALGLLLSAAQCLAMQMSPPEKIGSIRYEAPDGFQVLDAVRNSGVKAEREGLYIKGMANFPDGKNTICGNYGIYLLDEKTVPAIFWGSPNENNAIMATFENSTLFRIPTDTDVTIYAAESTNASGNIQFVIFGRKEDRSLTGLGNILYTEYADTQKILKDRLGKLPEGVSCSFSSEILVQGDTLLLTFQKKYTGASTQKRDDSIYRLLLQWDESEEKLVVKDPQKESNE